MENDLPDTKPFANFEWMLALRYLRARRKEGFISVISLFSFLGIMLGVATLIVVMSVLNGFRAELLDKILGFSGHATFYHQDLSPIPDFKEIQARLEKVDGVKRVISLVEGQAMASSLEEQHRRSGARHRGSRYREAVQHQQQGSADVDRRAGSSRPDAILRGVRQVGGHCDRRAAGVAASAQPWQHADDHFAGRPRHGDGHGAAHPRFSGGRHLQDRHVGI